MISPQDIKQHLITIIFSDEPTVRDLFSLVVAFAIIWFIVFSAVKTIVRPLIHNKKWLLDAMSKEYERHAKKQLEELNMDMTKDEYIAFSMRDWPRLQSISSQHLIGSLFCIPSILGIGDPSLASSLAACGILSEIGWELQDVIEMILVRMFHKEGKKIFPDVVFIIFLVHHTLASCLGIPVILYYRHHKTIHWICFDLQFAAGLALSFGEITKVLDITNPRHLRLFKALNFIALVTMVWTRIIHWTYLTTTLFITWYNDKAWAFLFFGILISILFTGFSYVVCVKPFYKKFVKFLHVSAEYEALPPDASADRRRSSVIQLDLARSELLEAELLADFQTVFQKRKVARRQSVPILRGGRGRRGSLFALQLQQSKSFGYEVTKSKDL
eukprot:CAMPEP_0201714042 /NCGR_PEP_ID=MMETSP0593-20130828/662_1 /ASSEMBLY_ACC=CAM_ASM_000672 /TAXON_ID=267983 /ORGANISM="Skeletonema japonicum, Strain CCMP2506" /LENGTH=385 /DNA_ID=CAMNT_0048203267 /DNA_START=26 /DNA_END=1183 /DNA_ORIENTATION=-